MTPTLSRCVRLALMVALPLFVVSAPVGAQRRSHDAGSGRQAAPRGEAVPRGDTKGTPAQPSGPSSGRTSSDGSGRSGRQPSDGGGTSRDGDRTGSRPRDGQPAIGEAVPRTQPPERGRTTIIVPGYYGGYGYGGFGYYGYYDPYWYPDPYGYGAYGSRYPEGSLRLKVKPRAASVFVDGYYTGIVDDFDGLFQRLRIEAGPHRIELQAPGFDSLTFDVRIEPRRATTYRGKLRKVQ